MLVGWALLGCFLSSRCDPRLVLGAPDMSVSDTLGGALKQHAAGNLEAALLGYLDALPMLREADADGAVLAKVSSNVGAIYMRQGEYALARDHFQLAVEACPSDAAARMNLAIVLTSQLDQHAEALVHARRVVEQSPDNSKAHHLVGNILQSSGDERAAEPYFVAAERLAQAAMASESAASSERENMSSLFARLHGVVVGDSLEAEADGQRFSMRCLSVRPLVFSVRGLLSSQECAHIVARSADKLQRSFAMGGGREQGEERGAGEPPSVDGWQAPRASANTWLSADAVLSALQRRVAALTGLSAAHVAQRSEELQVVRYGSGGYFSLHQDSSAFHRRRVTALLYLCDLPEGAGGETWFPFAGREGDAAADSVQEAIDRAKAWSPYAGQGLLVSPRLGDGVIFLNHVISDGSLDPTAVHAGLEVADGFEKWVANYWVD